VNAITDFVRNIDKSLEKDVYEGVKFSEFLFLSEKERKVDNSFFSIELILS